MRDPRHMVAAVALLCATGCAAHDESPRVDAPEAPPSGQGGAATPGAVSLVLASTEGVDLIGDDGEPVRLTHEPAAVAFGVRHDLVAYQRSRSRSDTDTYPPPPEGPVTVWSDGIVSELPTGRDVSSVRLLDAKLISGRPVVLVAERSDEGQPDSAAEALVLIDLVDLTRRTVAPRQPAWESGHQVAQLLLDGDVIALHQHGTQVDLVRWSTQERRRSWSINVADNRRVSLVTSQTSVAVVVQSFDRRREFAPTLTITPHDPSTGEPRAPTVLDVIDPDGVIGTGLFCTSRVTASTIVCAQGAGAPVAVADDGSFSELAGPPGAIPSVVQDG